MDKFLYLWLINLLQIKTSSKPNQKESKGTDTSACKITVGAQGRECGVETLCNTTRNIRYLNT